MLTDLVNGLLLHQTKALESPLPEHFRRIVFLVHFSPDLARQVQLVVPQPTVCPARAR